MTSSTAATALARTDAGSPLATITRTVEWSDTDAAGHHHNSAVLRWAEAAEAQLCRTLGIIEIFGDCPRAQQTVNYTAKLWFGQEITATVAVGRVGGSSVTFTFEVYGEEFEGRERQLAAHGSVVTVHVDPATGASAPWPEKIRGALTGS